VGVKGLYHALFQDRPFHGGRRVYGVWSAILSGECAKLLSSLQLPMLRSLNEQWGVCKASL
jgi:hypothetical protein